MLEQTRILLVDKPSVTGELKALFAKMPNPARYEIAAAESLDEGVARLSKSPAEVVLLDIALFQKAGERAVARIREKCPHVPVIVLAEHKDESAALEAVGKGAEDYLVKSELNPNMLARVIRYAIERARADEAVLKAHQKNEQILASIPSILIGIGGDAHHITHWNAAAGATLGVSGSDTVGKSLRECGAQWDGHAVAKAVDDCRVSLKPVRLDNLRFSRADGYEGFLGFTIIPIKTETDESQFLMFGANITERKRLEQLKGEFVSTVSHELRTPMAIIREGVSQVLEGILGSITDPQREFLSMSLENIDRLTRIINDLLDMSKIEAGKVELKREWVDLTKVAAETAASFQMKAQAKGLEVRSKSSHASVELYIDRDKTIQVFTNLIFNSLKFTEKGFIEVQVDDKGDYVECGIQDTGKGIAKEDLPRVFGKFQQFGRTDGPGEKGTGLGLAICKGIVELHHGKIGLESKLGEGTRFWFTLPKYSARELFSQSLTHGLDEADKKGLPMSVIHLHLPSAVGPERSRLEPVLKTLEQNLKSHWAKQGRFQIRDGARFLVAFSVKKEEALMTAGSLRELFSAEFLKNGIPDGQWVCRVAGFPEDGASADELLEKIL